MNPNLSIPHLMNSNLSKYFFAQSTWLPISFPVSHFSFALHKKWSFSLNISSVYMTKSEGNSEKILNKKLHFLYNADSLNIPRFLCDSRIIPNVFELMTIGCLNRDKQYVFFSSPFLIYYLHYVASC